MLHIMEIPIRNAIRLPWDVYMTIVNEKTPANPDLFKSLRGVDAFLEQFLWHAKMLKAARAEVK